MARVNLIGISAAVLVVLIMVLYLVFVPVNDIVVEKYETYADVVKNCAYEHGMVPDFLPNTAIGVISERNIDLNVMVVEFSYGDDFSLFLSNQKAIKFNKNIEIPIVSDSVIDISNVDSLVYINCVKTKDEDSYGSLVVNTVQKRAVFWTEP